MKLKNKVSGEAVKGPFVAIGNRGVTCPMTVGDNGLVLSNGVVIPKGATLNEWQDLPPKIRGGADLPGQPLYRRVHSFVQSRTDKGPNGKAQFFLGTLALAVQKKLVKVIENVTIERKLASEELQCEEHHSLPRKATGTLVLPADWAPGQKTPKMVGFVPNAGQKWPGGRIEQTLVNEADKSPARNDFVVAKIHWPDNLKPKDDAKAKDNGGKKDAKADTKKAPAKAAAKPAPKAEKKEAVAA
jgi:hypothetical protein